MEITTFPWQMVILCGLSLCVGWGIRGNFGHEYGAALPGALAAIAIVPAFLGARIGGDMSTILRCSARSAGPSGAACPTCR